MKKLTPPRLLIISHDVVGQQMAGPGIRYWELARVLSAQQPVTLIAPRPIDRVAPGICSGAYTWGDARSLANWIDQSDVVFANGFVLVGHPELAQLRQPLALDLYDPTLLENLELFRRAPDEERVRQNQQDSQLLAQQLAAGDFFVCATERQRDLYLGALMGADRITPAATDHDPQLRGLINVVPFGLPTAPPVKQAPALREMIPGIGTHDQLVLWTGGLWDWLDPLTLVRAMPQIIAQHPQTRLVFLAGQHPGTIQAMHMPAATQALAAELGLRNTHIFFYEEWVPYAQRADFLLEADLAVSLHRNHLETAYAAVRSRFLDHLWAGLPSVVSDGDAVAALVHEHKLGLVVPPEDSTGTAQAVASLITDDAQYASCAQHAQQFAREWTWERLVTPLAHFCREPTRTRPSIGDSTTTHIAEISTPSLMEGLPLMQQQQELVQQLERLWQLTRPIQRPGPITGLLRRLITRLAGPILAQQQEFNAHVVKLAYASLTQDGDTLAYLQAVLSQTLAVERALKRVDTIERDLHGRLNTISEFNGQVNDRLERLTYVARLLNDAVAAADEATAMIAVQMTDQTLGLEAVHQRVSDHD